jgi:AraC-like DNA-binding protein
MAPDQNVSHASAVGGPLASSFSFSTDWIPEPERLDFFKGELSKLLALDVEPLDGRPRHVMKVVEAGPISFSEVHASPTRVARRRNHLNDCDDGFLFILVTEGRQLLMHNGHEITLDPGAAALIQNSRTGIGTFPTGGTTIAARVDGSSLRALVKHPEEMAGGLIDRKRPGLALLTGYLRAFAEVKETLTSGLAQSFGHHVVDLVAAVLGPTHDGAAQAEAGGIRAARLRQVLDAIAGRACDPCFTVETIAGELGVTSRYVQRLLEATGSTFSEHVTERRLIRARQLLGGALCRGKVSEIALEAGFNDLAHFHRVFRRRFGSTPAAMRGATALA